MIIIDEVLVSDDILEKQFVCNLTRCKGACCKEGDYGAPLNDEEIVILETELEKIKPFLSDESRIFLAQHGVKKYFKELSGFGTQLLDDGRCVFVTEENGQYKCGIEQAQLSGAISFKKPISCHLYPIRISKNEAIGFEAMNYDEWDICSAACSLGEELKIPVYKFLKEAIIRKYGESFYEALDYQYKEKKSI